MMLPHIAHADDTHSNGRNFPKFLSFRGWYHAILHSASPLHQD